MSERDRKREGAMRLFGALSGVDEEYLAGCEADKQASRGAVRFWRTGFVRRYGAAVAAALGVIVLGISAYVYQFSGGGKTASMDCAPQENVAARLENAGEQKDFPQEGVEAAEDEAAEAPAGGQLLGDTADENLTAPRQEEQSMMQQDGSMSVKMTDQKEKMDGLAEEKISGERITLEQARAVPTVGEYLPDELPVDSGECEVYAVTEPGQEKVMLVWNREPETEDSEWFCLEIDNLGENGPAWTDSSTLLAAEELTKEAVESVIGTRSGEDAGTGTRGGYGAMLGILYEEEGEYVLLTYRGEMTAKQVWEMLGSVKQ